MCHCCSTAQPERASKRSREDHWTRRISVGVLGGQLYRSVGIFGQDSAAGAADLAAGER